MSILTKHAFLFTVLFLGLFFLFQNYVSEPSFVQFNPEALEATLIKIEKSEPLSAPKSFYNKLTEHAIALLRVKNPSVIDKAILPPSNNRHNYLSISRYYWPNPKRKDSLPWILKDGKPNPYTQTRDVDRKSLEFLSNSVHQLSLGYLLTKDEKYAIKGISMLKTWFLDAKTLMNPNLKYAQIIPGDKNPQRTGILDGRSIPATILDAYIIFSSSKYWNPKDSFYMDLWFTEYLQWLRGSEIGEYAALQTNNHGSWYQFQVAALSFHLGKKEITKKAIEDTKKLISKQFNIDGIQVYENNRSQPFAYSWFNLEALIRLAIIGEKVGDDLWNYKTKDGKDLQKAIHFLMNDPHFSKLYNKSDIESLSSLYFVLHYYQKNVVLTNSAQRKVDLIMKDYASRIKTTPFSILFNHYYLIEADNSIKEQ